MYTSMYYAYIVVYYSWSNLANKLQSKRKNGFFRGIRSRYKDYRNVTDVIDPVCRFCKR